MPTWRLCKFVKRQKTSSIINLQEKNVLQVSLDIAPSKKLTNFFCGNLIQQKKGPHGT
jgi:hypothetical protein